jgi:hypothetical protein
MADPRNELADIIVPAAPAVAATAGGGGLLPWALAALAFIATVVLAAWLWHRRRPLRVLNAIAVAAVQRQTSPSALAARLDVWARTRFRLARLDAANCPAGLDADAWSSWAETLERLRFAAPKPDGFEELAALCERARQWSRHA